MRRLLVVGGVIVGIGGIGVAVALLVGGDDGNHRGFTIPSEAMEPTISVGEHVDVDLDAYRDASPGVGDIVIFYPPHGAEGGATANAGRELAAPAVRPAISRRLRKRTCCSSSG